MMEAKGFDRIKAITYSNAESFATSTTLGEVESGIGKLLDKLQEDKIAGRKVDVVVHSMGGLVVRKFCADKPAFCRNKLRKLITIDTPHQGSELADWLLLYVRHRDEKGGFYDQLQQRSLSPDKKTCNKRVDAFVMGGKVRLDKYFPLPFVKAPIPAHPVLQNGAVDSLADGTVAPNTIPPGHWDDPSMSVNGVRTHALVGRMPKIPDVLAAAFTPVSKDMWWLWKRALSSCGLKREDVFGGLANGSDGVVSGSSQEGRFSPYTDISTPVDHLSVTETGEVVEKVRGLLDGGMERFSPLGTP